MEARYVWTAAAVLSACASMGAAHRTQNFTCNAATQEIAVQVCEAAELYRRDLAVEWLGRELPNWSKPCPITVQVGPRLGAGGATSFVFDQGEVFGWQMTIQGSLERVLDSVLPHEVTHTIFATHFRRPLPRWADEGACTTVEHASERNKQQRMLVEFLQTGRGISFSQMFAMTEYPPDVLPLYAQGHSLASFLIYQGGKQKFVQFVGSGMQTNDWGGTLQKFYGIRNLGTLQNTWIDWVAQGSPAFRTPSTTAVAAAEPTSTSAPVEPFAAAPTPASPVSAMNAPPPTTLASAEVVAPESPYPASPYPSSWNGKRRRPEPNLVHHGEDVGASPAAGAESSVVATPTPSSRPMAFDPGDLVPVVLDDLPVVQPSRQVASQGAAPLQMNGASRPQTPETPRQVILEWSKGPEGTPLNAPPPMPGFAPAGSIYDASGTGGVMRR